MDNMGELKAALSKITPADEDAAQKWAYAHRNELGDLTAILMLNAGIISNALISSMPSLVLTVLSLYINDVKAPAQQPIADWIEGIDLDL